jgi:tetratricopeptide (TPR) repeat protein
MHGGTPDDFERLIGLLAKLRRGGRLSPSEVDDLVRVITRVSGRDDLPGLVRAWPPWGPKARPPAAAALELPRTVDELEDEALRLRRRGIWGTDALTVNERLLDLDPENVGAWSRKARCLMEAGDFDGSEVAYERVRLLTKSDASMQKVVERALRDLQQARQAKAAEASQDAEGRRDIDSTKGWRDALHLAIRFRESGRLDLAVEAHERSLVLASNDTAHRHCVSSYSATKRRLGRWKDAATSCSMLLADDPDPVRNLEAYTCLTAALGDAGWLQDAKTLLDAILPYVPRDMEIAQTARSIYGRVAAEEGAGEWYAGQRELDHRWQDERLTVDDRVLGRLRQLIVGLLEKLRT